MKTKITCRKLFCSILLVTIFSCCTSISFSQQIKPSQTGYAPVNGLKMYYEVYGEGEPLVLLHGAFMTIDLCFGQMIPTLAKTHKVIAFEMQGHGHTADIDRPISQDLLADDVAAALDYLKTNKADILGYSLGGEVALQLAIRHPAKVNKLIVVSAAYKTDGWSKETLAVFPMLNADMFNGTPIKTEYDSVAPDPKHFPQFVEKVKQAAVKNFDFGADNIKTIKSPTLLISADGDGVTPEHMVEMYRLLGGNYMIDFTPPHKTQLAIFPGTSHVSIMMQTDLMLSTIGTFLNTKM